MEKYVFYNKEMSFYTCGELAEILSSCEENVQRFKKKTALCLTNILIHLHRDAVYSYTFVTQSAAWPLSTVGNEGMCLG